MDDRDDSGRRELLRQLEATAALPLARARILPREFYWSRQIYSLEVERYLASRLAGDDS